MNNSFIHNDTPDALNRLKTAVNSSDAIVTGAGAGLSTSAGFNYSGECFHK